MMLALIGTMSDPDDRAFMESLYLEFEGLMYATVKKYIGEESDQMDVMQDVVVKLIRKVSTLRPMGDGALCGYIATTAKNTAIDFLRKKNRVGVDAVGMDEAQFSQTEDLALSLDDLMELSERRGYLQEALSNLSEEDRSLLEWKYFLDYSDEDLAQLFGCKVNSIRMKLTRARRRAFRQMMEHGKE